MRGDILFQCLMVLGKKLTEFVMLVLALGCIVLCYYTPNLDGVK